MNLSLAWRLACYFSGAVVMAIAFAPPLDPSLLMFGGGLLVIPGMVSEDELPEEDPEIGKPDYDKIARLERELLDGEPPRPEPFKNWNCARLGHAMVWGEDGCLACGYKNLPDPEPDELDGRACACVLCRSGTACRSAKLSDWQKVFTTEDPRRTEPFRTEELQCATRPVPATPTGATA